MGGATGLGSSPELKEKHPRVLQGPPDCHQEPLQMRGPTVRKFSLQELAREG